MKKLLSLLSLFICFISFAQTAPEYYKQAQESIEKWGKPNPYAKEYIDKALMLDSSNVDYRWIRVQCNMTSSSQEKEWKQAINDIKYIISTGKETGKLYANLGVSYHELANFSASRQAKKSTGFEDTDNNYYQTQKSYYDDAISKYKLAAEAFNKAAQIDPEKKDKYLTRAKAANYEITQVTDKAKNITK